MTFPLAATASGRDWLAPLGITVLLAAVAAAVAALPSPWTGWAPATCLPGACFCEGIRDQLIRQPANAISSLFFLPPGLVILRRGRPDAMTAAGYGLALILIGLGSAWYHASLTFPAQTADVLGMYLLATFAVMAAARRRWHLTAGSAMAGYLTANVLLFILLVEAPAFRRHAFAGLIGVALLLEWRLPRPAGRRNLFLALGCLGLGLAAWGLDLAGLACSSGSWIQGHAIWHGLTAAAATIFYHHATAPEAAP